MEICPHCQSENIVAQEMERFDLKITYRCLDCNEVMAPQRNRVGLVLSMIFWFLLGAYIIYAVVDIYLVRQTRMNYWKVPMLVGLALACWYVSLLSGILLFRQEKEDLRENKGGK